MTQIGEDVEREQIANVKGVKKKRDAAAVAKNLKRLKEAAAGTENVMPHILDCVRSYGSLGEICDVFRSVFGEYHDPKWL